MERRAKDSSKIRKKESRERNGSDPAKGRKKTHQIFHRHLRYILPHELHEIYHIFSLHSNPFGKVGRAVDLVHEDGIAVIRRCRRRRTVEPSELGRELFLKGESDGRHVGCCDMVRKLDLLDPTGSNTAASLRR